MCAEIEEAGTKETFAVSTLCLLLAPAAAAAVPESTAAPSRLLAAVSPSAPRAAAPDYRPNTSLDVFKSEMCLNTSKAMSAVSSFPFSWTPTLPPLPG